MTKPSSVTAWRSPNWPPPKARRSMSTAPPPSPSAIARSTTRSRSHPHAVHYALKANSTLAIARLLRGLGSRADANSGGEIDVALRAGFIPEQIVFTGVGKTAAELAQAIDLGVKSINAESEGELERIDIAGARAADARPRRAAREPRHRCAQPSAHLDGDEGEQVRHRRSTPRARSAGARSGAKAWRSSGCTRTSDRRSPTSIRSARAAQAIVTLARELARRRDRHRSPRSRRRTRRVVRRLAGAERRRLRRGAAARVRDSGLAIVLEPGRHIVAPAGALLSRVVDVKDRPGGKVFVILDAGMTELIRPMLYGAFHRHRAGADRPAVRRSSATSSGRSARAAIRSARIGRCLGPPVGDLLAVLDAGAYGAVMASNYNRRPMPAEVLVDGRRSGR